ncbi:MAG TPA: formyltransferase family protein [Bacillota bacterium]|nr:formyltransferase family protein [Bacillota bacterium]
MVVVLTYNTPHRKTQDLLFQLKVKSEVNITVIGLPFKYVKKFQPMIQHRPSKCLDISNSEFCKRLGFIYEDLEHDHLVARLKELNPKMILIAGAGILDKEIVNDYFVVNSHPGILPDVRGLDALKWAIYLGKKIGVTLHVINEEADGGFRIKEELIPLYKNDTFHSIAYRQYEYEIDLLSDSVRLLQDVKSKAELPRINTENTKPNIRMGLEEEKRLFDKLKQRLEEIK